MRWSSRTVVSSPWFWSCSASFHLSSPFAFLCQALCKIHSHCRGHHSEGSLLGSFLLLQTARHSAESLYRSHLACISIHKLICQLAPAHTNTPFVATFSGLEISFLTLQQNLADCFWLKMFNFMKDFDSQCCINKLYIKPLNEGQGRQRFSV